MNESFPTPQPQEENNKQPEKTGFLKKIAVMAGLTAATTGALAHEGKTAETELLSPEHKIETSNPSDTTTKKEASAEFSSGIIGGAETVVGKELFGMKIEGIVPVASLDTSKQFFFIKLFPLKEKDKTNIGNVLRVIDSLGFKAGQSEDLKSVYMADQNVARKIGGYGMSIGDKVTDGNIGFATINPVGTKMMETKAIDELDIPVGEYPYLVYIEKKRE